MGDLEQGCSQGSTCHWLLGMPHWGNLKVGYAWATVPLSPSKAVTRQAQKGCIRKKSPLLHLYLSLPGAATATTIRI